MEGQDRSWAVMNEAHREALDLLGGVPVVSARSAVGEGVSHILILRVDPPFPRRTEGAQRELKGAQADLSRS